MLSTDLCYWAAICLAMRDLTNQKTSPLTCLVLGAGLGRLVTYCLDAANQCSVDMVTVHVVDANPVAVEFLRKSFESSSTHVIVHDAVTIYPLMTVAQLPVGLQTIHGSCDLVVSELLGCLGDDEFLPELTHAICHLFLNPNGIVIPDHWSIYCSPIQSHDTYNYITMMSSSCDPQLKATYTMSLPDDCVFLTELLPIHSNDRHCGALTEYKSTVKSNITPFMAWHHHPSQNEQLVDSHNRKPTDQVAVCKRRKPDDHQTSVIHGLIGYFVASLYKHMVFLDTRHSSHQRNAFHWECFYMPLSIPLIVAVGDQVEFEVSRHCIEVSTEGGNRKQLELNYHWSVLANGKSSDNHGNTIILSQ